MVANEEILRLNQAGFETTRGTAVAATRKVYANITPNFTKAIREFTDTSGTYAGRRRVAFQREIVTFAGVDLLTYEDLAWWAQLMIKGNVAGVSDSHATVPAYTYTFKPTLSSDDLEAMTLEWNHVGNAYESSQVMVNTWTIRIDPDNEGGWLLDTEMLARDISTTTHTGSLTDRTTEVISAPGTELYIDDTTLGSTQVTGQFISATITGNNNIHYKAFAEDTTAFAANKVGRGLRTYDATITMEFASDAEFAKMRAGTKRYVRLVREGAQINDTPTNATAQIDMNGYWSTLSWANREGNIIATFGLAAYYDATSGYDLQLTVINDSATLA